MKRLIKISIILIILIGVVLIKPHNSYAKEMELKVSVPAGTWRDSSENYDNKILVYSMNVEGETQDYYMVRTDDDKWWKDVTICIITKDGVAKQKEIDKLPTFTSEEDGKNIPIMLIGKDIKWDNNIKKVYATVNEISLEDIKNPVGTGIAGLEANIIKDSEDTSYILNPNDFAPTVDDSEAFKSRINIVIDVIRSIGIIIAVISLMAIGLKTMVGSVEEKAEFKKVLPGYIVGVILVVAITTLPTIIYNIVSSFNQL